MYVTDGRFDGTGPLAGLSPFSFMPWIRSKYLFRSEAWYSNVFIAGYEASREVANITTQACTIRRGFEICTHKFHLHFIIV